MKALARIGALLAFWLLVAVACTSQEPARGNSYPTPTGSGVAVVSGGRFATAAVTGTNGQTLTMGTAGPVFTNTPTAFTAAGDLSGSATSQVVAGIQSQPIATGTSGPGYIMAFGAGTAWAPLAPGTAGQVLQTNGIGSAASWVTPATAFTAATDLSGSATSQTVIAVHGQPWASGTAARGAVAYYGASGWAPLAAPTSTTKIIGFDGTDPAWVTPASGFTAGGDLTGSSSSQTVVAVRGQPWASGTAGRGSIAYYGASGWTPMAAPSGAATTNFVSFDGTDPTWQSEGTIACGFASCSISSEAQGDVLYRDSSAWARLGAGTSGQFLKTQGAGANPVWASLPATAISPAQVDTNQTNTNSSYGDLATTGPAVTVTTGTTALVLISASAANLGTSSGSGYISVAVSGATTIAASDANGTFFSSTTSNFFASLSRAVYLTGLTAGSNTFTVKYKDDSASSNWTFTNRTIAVFAL